MARLRKGEREERENMLLRLLQRLRWGVRESEIAQELGWQRRTVNNYLLWNSEPSEHSVHFYVVQ